MYTVNTTDSGVGAQVTLYDTPCSGPYGGLIDSDTSATTYIQSNQVGC